MYGVILALLAVMLVTPAHAQVLVDIGIHLPAPPQLVIVPEVRAVQYVPSAPVNLFFYSNQYWAFANGGWYVSAGYNGPWIVVAPQFVPRPVLRVPVNYYRMPPGHWKQWQKKQPPRWGSEWGREWADKRAWNDDRDRGESKGHGKGNKGKDNKGHGKGGAKSQGHGQGK